MREVFRTVADAAVQTSQMSRMLVGDPGESEAQKLERLGKLLEEAVVLQAQVRVLRESLEDEVRFRASKQEAREAEARKVLEARAKRQKAGA